MAAVELTVVTHVVQVFAFDYLSFDCVINLADCGGIGKPIVQSQ
jgi:hypothetical protein